MANWGTNNWGNVQTFPWGLGPVSTPLLPPGSVKPTGVSFDGDALFVPTLDGGELVFTSGEPIRSGGLRNASYLSMFGANDDDTGLADDKKSWWGNYLEIDPNRQYRGQTGRLLDTLPLVTSNLPVIVSAVVDDHAWMVETGVATEVLAEAAIIGPNIIEITVSINAVGEQSEFVFIENWKAGS